ncbi:hypothetical protein WEI85_44815 [Actinomycetes bacterium KLBMP 9797]
MAADQTSPTLGGKNSKDFEPPEKHKAADRAGKTLGNMAGSISAAIGAESTPVVLDRKGPHVSIKDLEDLIDRALEE